MIQNRAGERHWLAQVEKQTTRRLASWRGQCCTHSEYGIAFLARNVSRSTTPRRFIQALIHNHGMLFNSVAGQETYREKWLMQDSAMVQLGDNMYKAGVLGYSDSGDQYIVLLFIYLFFQ